MTHKPYTKTQQKIRDFLVEMEDGTFDLGRWGITIKLKISPSTIRRTIKLMKEREPEIGKLFISPLDNFRQDYCRYYWEKVSEVRLREIGSNEQKRLKAKEERKKKARIKDLVDSLNSRFNMRAKALNHGCLLSETQLRKIAEETGAI